MDCTTEIENLKSELLTARNLAELASGLIQDYKLKDEVIKIAVNNALKSDSIEDIKKTLVIIRDLR